MATERMTNRNFPRECRISRAAIFAAVPHASPFAILKNPLNPSLP
jgi:hypothetical protein